MKKLFVLIIVLLALCTCKKDKVLEPIPVLSMDGKRSVLVGEWEWEYSQCRVLSFLNGPSEYICYAKVDTAKFGMKHHISITSAADVIGTVNGTEVFRYKLNKVNFELDQLPVSFLGSYYYDETDKTLSFAIMENGGIYLKTMHDFLLFPVGNCSNNYKAEYHVLKKL